MSTRANSEKQRVTDAHLHFFFTSTANFNERHSSEIGIPMTDLLHEYFFGFRTLEGLSSCHRPVLEPLLLWYAAADGKVSAD